MDAVAALPPPTTSQSCGAPLSCACSSRSSLPSALHSLPANPLRPPLCTSFLRLSEPSSFAAPPPSICPPAPPTPLPPPHLDAALRRLSGRPPGPPVQQPRLLSGGAPPRHRQQQHDQVGGFWPGAKMHDSGADGEARGPRQRRKAPLRGPALRLAHATGFKSAPVPAPPLPAPLQRRKHPAPRLRAALRARARRSGPL
jgi:hypothetical protein